MNFARIRTQGPESLRLAPLVGRGGLEYRVPGNLAMIADRRLPGAAIGRFCRLLEL